MVKKGVVAKGKDEMGSSKDSVRNYCQFDDIDTILLSQPRTDSKPHFSSSASFTGFTVHDMLSDFYSVVNICNFERDGLRCRSGSVNIIVVVVVVIIIIKCTFFIAHYHYS